ncbi:hypothetical protein [Campylobacter sp. MIT 97-5078]|uniref:hypothetical protein n=1 Tax=Campylobacter sp. MIT 97-5078 TaxID=1548153 RepID=UPI000512F5F3|nr:hypothetical protein [Campylobacter sp. MIT 97-5078]KGI55370.1 hypothetical protein LR59_12345 [Campylobacter sp. MIT 97-5078]TQR27848.1 hypothetical protein DMB91_02805 [Campylobacter sp. MIT 97-5078]
MSDELLYLIFIVILQIALVAYIFIKDKENSLKIAKLEKAVEELSKNMHYLRKELEAKADIQSVNLQNSDDLKDEINLLLNKEVNSKIMPILKSLKGFESVIEEFQNEQENRLSHLEQKTQNISKLTPNYENEEQKIVDLFKEGKSIEQISKDLRIPTGSVEFTLKMKKMVD